MGRPVLVAFLAASLVPVPGAAQAQNPQPPPPVFKAGVELVRLDVQITDAEGNPISDLDQREIEVREGGEPRPVVLFQHLEEPAETYAEIARHTIAGEVSTNQGAARGHMYVLVFDQQHIAPGHEQRARLAARRFLEAALRPGDRAEVYALPGPGPHSPFTGDVRHLVPMLPAVRGLAEPQQRGVVGTMSIQEAFQISHGDELALRAVTNRIMATSPEVDSAGRLRGEDNQQTFTVAIREDARAIVMKADDQSRQMLSMLSDVIRPLAASEGRKSVLLFSEGFNGDNLRRELETVAAAAARSYSTITAIDLSERTFDIAQDVPATIDRSIGIQDAMTPLAGLALETAGRLVLDASGRLDDVLKSVAVQSQDYYLVGFTPRTDVHDADAYRRVTVRVRRSGARVSARTGFVLDDRTSRLSRRDAIDRALAAPFPQQGLPINYTTYVMRAETSGTERVVLSLETELPLTSASEAQPADVVFVVKSVGDGRVAASGTDTIRLPERTDRGLTTGVGTYHVQFDLRPGDYIMRAVVREPGGLIGSADRRLTVRPLDGPAVATGDLIVSGSRELAVRPAAYTEEGLDGLVQIYARTADQLTDARVVFDLLAPGEASPVLSGLAPIESPVALTNGMASTAHLELPLTGIAPGAYVARASVKIGPDTVAEVEREINVRPGRRPNEAEKARDEPFQPQEIVQGAFARDYVTALTRSGSPAFPAARRGLDRLAASDYTGAIAALESAVQADEKNGATSFFLGWAYHGAGDDRQAISAWRRAAYLSPSLVPIHLALADMYVRLSQPGLAIQALHAGLQALPQSPELLERLARLEPHR
jgi:VWFA-related protein